MRLALVASLGAVAVATAAGAGLGWSQRPVQPGNGTGTHLVLATVPTGPPVYVLPECTITQEPAFRPLPPTPADSGTPPQQQTAGRVPPGFVPVRGVHCVVGFLTGGFDVTQFETASDADLRTLLAALQPPRIAEPTGPVLACPAIGQVPMAIALVDARGAAVRVDLPRDECGLYATASLEKLGTVHMTVTGTHIAAAGTTSAPQP